MQRPINAFFSLFVRTGNHPRLSFAIALLAGAFCLQQSTRAAAMQTAAQLQLLFDQGQYAQLLPPLNQALADKSVAADPGKKYALLMLKGETLLRTKASAAAQDAFTAASTSSKDQKEIAIAKADVSLIKRSGNFKYQPKARTDGATALQPAIDIVDQASRKQAFIALFDDLYGPAKPIVAKAETETTLPPIIGVAPQVSELRSIELAGTGSDFQSKDLLTKLANHASDLMNNDLKTLKEPIPAITKAAAKSLRSRTVTASANGTEKSVVMTVGLSPQNVDKLDSIVTDARQIATAADEMKTTFGDIGAFATIKAEADKIVDQANKLLTKYNKPAA